MEDFKIIQELKKGNYKVFKHLYMHYSGIEKYVISNQGSKPDAKDVFQNSIIVFYEMVLKPDFELQSKISTLLYGIAKRDWLKKITRNKELTKEEFDSGIYQATETPKKDAFDILKEVLLKIGEPCKTLITLFHFDHLNWEDIAHKLNYANAHTARNQKHKCFLKIRKIIPDQLKNEILRNVG